MKLSFVLNGRAQQGHFSIAVIIAPSALLHPRLAAWHHAKRFALLRLLLDYLALVSLLRKASLAVHKHPSLAGLALQLSVRLSLGVPPYCSPVLVACRSISIN